MADNEGTLSLSMRFDAYLFLVNHRKLYDLRKVNQDWYLGMILDFPVDNLNAITDRMVELRIAADAEPVKWNGARWRERKQFKRPDLKSGSAAA